MSKNATFFLGILGVIALVTRDSLDIFKEHETLSQLINYLVTVILAVVSYINLHFNPDGTSARQAYPPPLQPPSPPRSFRPPPSSPTILLLILCPFLLLLSACDKTNALQNVNKTIHSTTFALKSADNAYKAGYLTFDQRKEVFIYGRDTNLTLTELNNFISNLPDDIITGKTPIDEDKKTALLKLVADGISRSNALVSQGAFIHDPKAQKVYIKYALPAQAFFLQTHAIILAWKTIPKRE